MFSVTLGDLRIGVISESLLLRELVESEFDAAVGAPIAREGLLLSRPGVKSAVGRPSWVLYESGDIVLRRTESELEAAKAAVSHLQAVKEALTGGWLPLRLRVVLQPDGSALLVQVAATHDLGGLDRRLRGRGYSVAATTIALVDVSTADVVVPETILGSALAGGRYPLAAVWLRGSREDAVSDVSKHLGIARSLVRTPDSDLDLALSQINDLLANSRVDVHFDELDTLREGIHRLGA